MATLPRTFKKCLFWDVLTENLPEKTKRFPGFEAGPIETFQA